MRNHEKLIYENDRGESIEIAYSFPFFLDTFTGADGTEANITKTQSAGQDGTTITNASLADRPLQILGGIRGYSKEEMAEYRAELLRVFNPKLKGTLEYEYGDIKRQIRCRVESAPRFSRINRDYRMQEFLINLIAPNPYWTDEFESGEEIVTWIGGMTFPLKLPTAFATKGTKIINIRNDGDVETPVKIEFRGPATNPKIENNGEFIKVNRTILEDDVLTITTEFGNKRVEINGENAFNWIDLDSVFWQLQPGDNIIKYTSDDEVEDATVKIAYKNRYLGI